MALPREPSIALPSRPGATRGGWGTGGQVAAAVPLAEAGGSLSTTSALRRRDQRGRQAATRVVTGIALVSDR